MTYYPTPTINKALGLEPAASLDDALTTIAQLRASLVDVAELREAVHRLRAQLEENERDMARAYQSYQAGAAREAAEYQAIRRELDRAQADNAELRRQIGALDRNLTEAESGRDAAFAALHYATGGFL